MALEATQPSSARTQASRIDGKADAWGIFCSVGCAVHCAAAPVLLSALPSVSSLRWLTDPAFHQVVSIACALLVARAIVPAWKKHRSDAVALSAIGGICLLFLAAFVLPDNCCNHSPIVATTNIDSPAPAQSESPFQLVSIARPVTPDQPSAAADAAVCDATLNDNWGKTLLNDHSLVEAIGYEAAQATLTAQPYLSPLGGLLLIIAHVLNIRLRCCRAGGCDSKPSR